MVGITDEVAALDAVTFQRWIHTRQYPHDCSQTTGLLTRAGRQLRSQKQYQGDYFYGLGLGSQMASLKYNLQFREHLKIYLYTFSCYTSGTVLCTLRSTL